MAAYGLSCHLAALQNSGAVGHGGHRPSRTDRSRFMTVPQHQLRESTLTPTLPRKRGGRKRWAASREPGFLSLQESLHPHDRDVLHRAADAGDLGSLGRLSGSEVDAVERAV